MIIMMCSWKQLNCGDGGDDDKKEVDWFVSLDGEGGIYKTFVSSWMKHTHTQVQLSLLLSEEG